MQGREPITEAADVGFPVGTELTPWPQGEDVLRQAKTYWLTTVRPGGRPHVAPVWGVWLEGALYFSTGASSRKARNLAAEPRCCVSVDSEALQVVVEGRCSRVAEEGTLARVAEAYGPKYDWPMSPTDGGLVDESGNGVPV
jgi:nitroimidazol reductase NimA-like FMN-containing flavoprotein (pyridoxamine 5'-phosphate oxidase superfamily)